MSRLLSILAMLTATCISHAEEKPKPNTLTDKEIRDGWILLFDGETTFGWKTEGDVTVKDGILTVGGKNGGSIETTTSFGHSEVFFEFTVDGDARIERANDSISPAYDGGKSGVSYQGLEWATARWPSGNRMKKQNAWDFFHRSLSINIGLFADPKDDLVLKKLRFKAPKKASIKIRSVQLRPTGTQPIFNGKTLEGWKVFPGEKYKSKYSVTPEGWLNVKDGPGDLQTAKQYADFTLQLECISNGKMLNSGIFFRCLADQYQKGYEVQIQNGFIDKDRTKPIDYGTGAIYRRVKGAQGCFQRQGMVHHDRHRAGQTLRDLGQRLPDR